MQTNINISVVGGREFSKLVLSEKSDFLKYRKNTYCIHRFSSQNKILQSQKYTLFLRL